MRIADSYYVQRENEQAVKYYKEALALKSGYEDQGIVLHGENLWVDG